MGEQGVQPVEIVVAKLPCFTDGLLPESEIFAERRIIGRIKLQGCDGEIPEVRVRFPKKANNSSDSGRLRRLMTPVNACESNRSKIPRLSLRADKRRSSSDANVNKNRSSAFLSVAESAASKSRDR